MRRGQVRTVAIVWSVSCALLLTSWLFWPLDSTRLYGQDSLQIRSADGRLLFVGREPQGGSYREWIHLKELPPTLSELVVLSEDGRFFWHWGFDPLAIARAALQNVGAGRVVSGGSTISQQLARIVWHEQLPQTPLLRKLAELGLAGRLEAQLSKAQILELYLNRVPLPHNRSGFAAASRALLGKDIRLVDAREAMHLVVLLRGTPRSREELRGRVEFLAARAKRVGLLVEGQTTQQHNNPGSRGRRPSASGQSVSGQRDAFTSAPATAHFVAWLREQRLASSGSFTTTVLAEQSEQVRRILRSELSALADKGAHNAAVVIFEWNQTEQLLMLRTMIGSSDFARGGDGQINGATARRSAGSTLKPFVYGLAMDRFALRPWQTIDDRVLSLPTTGAGFTYTPVNYDGRHWGALTLREALASSRNVPTVALASRLGTRQLSALLRRAQIDSRLQRAWEHGPALALGSGGARLVDLTRAYALFLNGGSLPGLILGRDDRGRPLWLEPSKEGPQVISAASALRIREILADSAARKRTFGARSNLSFPFDVAAKTGTASNNTDSWAVGFTPRYVVGVWLGNFDGRPMRAVTGSTGAGRIFQKVVRLVSAGSRLRFQLPPGWQRVNICQQTGLRPRPTCRAHVELFTPDETPPAQTCHDHPKDKLDRDAYSERGVIVRRPAGGQVFLLDPQLPRANQRVPIDIEVSEHRPGLKFSVDNGPEHSLDVSVSTSVSLAQGSHQLRVFDVHGLLQTVLFEVR